ELESILGDFKSVFLEAASQTLVHRYAQTRRPHPLESKEVGLEQALIREREGLAKFRDKADLVLDTSGFSVHDLRRKLQFKWDAVKDEDPGMRLHIISFGFKYGLPLEADMIMDLRFLPNPYFEPEMRPLTGEDEQVRAYVLKGNSGEAFVERFNTFLDFLIPLYVQEGRYRLTLAFGCTGGMHRSVAVARLIAGHLRRQGFALSLEHRHIHLG
ncbi:MAG: RNase adapter RapZ, partial [Desulfovibrionales bacterium]